MSRIIRMLVSYDGTDFAGWQRQPASHGMSVQQTLEDTLCQLLRERVTVHGAGRTDAGVHAWGQCCHFCSDVAVPVEKLPLILNRKLPPSVRIRAAETAAADFHARFSACGKHYRYTVERGALPSAFCGRYSWQVTEMLDVAAMRRAAAYLIGRHDFRHFTVSGVSAREFTRTIHRLEIHEPAQPQPELMQPWQQQQAPLLYDVEGDGFLYKMVRIIVGRLLAVGSGMLAPEAMAGFLDGSERRNIPPAPGRGLMLMAVHYGSTISADFS